MNTREFLAMIQHEAVEYPSKRLLKELRSPKSSGVEWFANLNDDGRKAVEELLKECSELSVLCVLTVLDGVGGSYDGTFELIAKDAGGQRTRVNPEDDEMLHNVFSDLIAESQDQP